MGDIRQYLLNRNSPTYSAYYNGKMSYRLHSNSWEKYVSKNFPGITDQDTSENVYKDVIDLYTQNLVPIPEELRGFSNTLIPLLSRGEAPVVVDNAGGAHFPEHYEMVSDGRFTVAAVFTRSLETMEDFVTYVWSDGRAELWSKPVPDDLSPADPARAYTKVEESTGYSLFRFALDDKGFGPSLAALQDRVNHSILDQTVLAEMYVRPFWYLLNTELAPQNPYLPVPRDNSVLKEHEGGDSSGRVFVTSSSGPFGQLQPPTITDMITYHDSITSKVSQTTGIPEFFFKPGNQVPSGVALKVLSRRFNNKIARIRTSITPQLLDLADVLGVTPAEGDEELHLWPVSDDLLQDALDAHGEALFRMGYPVDYIAEVVTPGVDLDEYLDDGFRASGGE